MPSERTRRYTTLSGAILVGLASGSNYVYSGYAPQLSSRLNISSTKTNIIGIAGNLGVYMSGPLWGRVIDARGPRIPLSLATVFQFVGYSTIRLIYKSETLFRVPLEPALSHSPNAQGGGSLSYSAFAGIAGGRTTISDVGMVAMVIAMALTGMAATAGLISGMNTVAKSFGEGSRGLATSMTIAGYGLSAFLFSQLSHALFPGNTSAFLLLLAIGTSLPLLLGVFIVRVVPVGSGDGDGSGAAMAGGRDDFGESNWGRRGDYLPVSMEGGEEDYVEGGETRGRSRVSVEGGENELGVHVRAPSRSPSRLEDGTHPTGLEYVPTHSHQASASRATSMEYHRRSDSVARDLPSMELGLTRSHSNSSDDKSPQPHPHFDLDPNAEDRKALLPPRQHHHEALEGSLNRSKSAQTLMSVKSLLPGELDVHGGELFRKLDFWLLILILLLLSGTGLMYINNVGSVVLALANEGGIREDYDPAEVSRYQAVQVSTISIWNCLGRVAMGFATDFAKTRFKIRRIWFASLVSTFFLISQISAQRIHIISHLWRVSSILGFAYGNMFALLPIVTLEWFGLAHFSSNWGIVSLASAVGGNIANLVFGRVYDSHTQTAASPLAVEGLIPAVTELLKRGGGATPDPTDHSHDCIIGQDCYETAFQLTTAGCFIALLLSIYAAVRRERGSRERRRRA